MSINYHHKIVDDIETHSVQGIRECFANGVGANDLYQELPLIYELISEYGRGPAFKDCVKAFVENGLEFNEPALLLVLLDNAEDLDKYLALYPGELKKKFSLRAAYTPLQEVELMHICAEFNHVSCAEILLQHGAGINSVAGVDEFGLGGQTPIFHTVNQNSNHSINMLDFLLEHSASLTFTVPGLLWGRGYPWETLIPAVNPISYAMMGLLPQMHRNEYTISKLVSRLMKSAYGIDYLSENIPNKYLNR